MNQTTDGIPDPSEFLVKSFESFQGTTHGKGIAKFNIPPNTCLCQRPYSHIICLNCGHLMFGRVRYRCPKHKMVTFLIDITNCPKCKSFEYMLNEFDVKEDEDL